MPTEVYSYETRVNACGEYLVGRKSVATIAAKYGIKQAGLITYWIQQRGCFKVRVEKVRRVKESQEAQANSPATDQVRAPVQTRSYHKNRAPAHLIEAFKGGAGPQMKKMPGLTLEQKR